MKSGAFSPEQPSPLAMQADFRHSLQAAERDLMAFQQRYASDRNLAKAHAMVELAISEIRKKRSE
jgi:hypothetical protein